MTDIRAFDVEDGKPKRVSLVDFELEDGTHVKALPVVMANVDGLVPGMVGYVGPFVVPKGSDGEIQRSGTATDPVNVTITEAIELVQEYEDVILQNAATTTGDGTIIDIGGYTSLLIEIYGTSTSKTVLFLATGESGTFQAITGLKKMNLASPFFASQSTTNTSTTPEIWEFDVGGLKSFKANISVIANGNCTIKGRLF